MIIQPTKDEKKEHPKTVKVHTVKVEETMATLSSAEPTSETASAEPTSKTAS